jgi:hypothetical protein
MYKILYVNTIEYVIQHRWYWIDRDNTTKADKAKNALVFTMMFSSVQLVNVVVINKGFFIVLCLFQTVDDSSIILTVVETDISTQFKRVGW